MQREYILHAPARIDRNVPAPLVIALHGGGGTAAIQREATGWDALADREGFLVLYPQATRKSASEPASFLRNPCFWNAGSGIGFPASVDDVGFIAALLDDNGRTYAIDPRLTFVSGFSNGAAMAMRLGIELCDRIAAVGAVAGHLWLLDRRPARPASMLYIVGDVDPLCPWDGGTFTTPWGAEFTSPPVMQTLDAWGRWIDTPARFSIDCPDGVRFTRYGPDARGTELQVYRIPNCGHVWPGGPAVLAERITGPSTNKLDATQVMWEFFTRHPAAS